MINLYEYPTPQNPMHLKIADRFRPHVESAAMKTSVNDLTEEEIIALMFFAGVHYELDPMTGRMTFGACSIEHINGKWVVVS